MKSVLSRCFPMEISTFSLLFYWNLYFLFTFLWKSLLSLYLSIEISTSSLIFLLKSLLSFYFSIEISTFSLLFNKWIIYFLALSNRFPNWNFYFRSLSEHFPIEVSTFWSFSYWNPTFCHFLSTFYWNLYFLGAFLLKPLLFGHLLKSLLSITF